MLELCPEYAIFEVQRTSGKVVVVATNAIPDMDIAGYHIPKGIFVVLNLGKLAVSAVCKERPGQALAKVMILTFASMSLLRYKVKLLEEAETSTTEAFESALIRCRKDYKNCRKTTKLNKFFMFSSIQ